MFFMANLELGDIVCAFEKNKINGVKVSQTAEPRSLVVNIGDVSASKKDVIVKRAYSLLYDKLGLGTFGAKYDKDKKALTLEYSLAGRDFLGTGGCGSSMCFVSDDSAR